MAAASFTTVRILTLANTNGAPSIVREVLGDFTPSTSYPALGEVMTPSLFGMQQVDNVVPLPPSDGSRIVTYDGTTNKLRIYTAVSTEAGTGTDQSTKVLRLVVTGSA
jgi:hypothetical protein